MQSVCIDTATDYQCNIAVIMNLTRSLQVRRLLLPENTDVSAESEIAHITSSLILILINAKS